MSDKKFNWSDEDNEEFRDIPEEVGQQTAPAVQVEMPRTTMTREQILAQVQSQNKMEGVEQVEQIYDTGTDEEGEEDYSEVLSDARLRLEQGRLYEMVMNNNLFEGTEADDRAVKSVQRAIKKFAKEQMEVMLGMRQAVHAAMPVISSPFNELEVTLLKSLAFKMSGGKTEEEQPEKYIAPVATPKRTSIKPIAASKSIQKSQPLAKTPAAPLKRQAPVKPSPEELLGLPPEPEKPLEKPPSEMTLEEKAARMKRIHERQSALKAKPPQNILPQPTPDQEAMLATIRATEADSKGTVSAIMALLNAQKTGQ